jgi:Base plate wedge protein 53
MSFSPVDYGQPSPYFSTKTFEERFLDVMEYRDIPREGDDLLRAIPNNYHLRPDLLAYDLYGQSSLWWVFAMRNPNTLLDPLWDFTAGTQIYLPQKKTLLKALGA